MITYKGQEYDLKYSIGRIDLIENSTGSSVMADLTKDAGRLSLRKLKIYFAYGLKKAGADSFEPMKTGMDICEELLTTEGYIPVLAKVLEALERDCPFFFQGA